jgi:cellulose synthase/poly-beta-1,6-N-acetylglucosamine synthase-like glycosyltransferase
MGDISFTIFIWTSLLYVVHLGFYLVGADLYDIAQTKRRRKKNSDYKPLVTVLIPAHNEEKVIIRCLDSVCNNSYNNLQIIVADDASKDTTRKLVLQYIKAHQNLDLQIITLRKNSGKGEALNTALRKAAKGDLVMTLDADSILTRQTVAHAVAYFTDPTIVGVAANVQLLHEPTILGTLQKFEHMIGYRSKKAYSVTNCEFVIGGVASTYRMKVLKEVGFYDTDTQTEDIGLSMKIVSNGNRVNRIIYAVDVMAMTEGVESFRGLLKQRFRWKYGSLQNLIKYHRLIGNMSSEYTPSLTLYRLPMAILSELVLLFTPITWGFTLFFTLSELNLGLILGAYMTVTLYMGITLLADEHLSRKERLRLSLYVPISYFIFYVMDIIQLIGIVRCLLRSKSLFMRTNQASTWVSPRRVGKRVLTQ